MGASCLRDSGSKLAAFCFLLLTALADDSV